MPTRRRRNHSSRGNNTRGPKTVRAVFSFTEHPNVTKFRGLLAAASEKNSEGDIILAAQLLRLAIQLGTERIPRFDNNSLCKAHAQLKLGLTSLIICTAFNTEELSQVRDIAELECLTCIGNALSIFESRLFSGKPVVFRSDECWLKPSEEVGSSAPYIEATGENDASLGPQIERIGPNDYMNCAHMAMCGQNPSKVTVQTLAKAVSFGRYFIANQCVISLERNERICMTGKVSLVLIDKLFMTLEDHIAVLDGRKTLEEFRTKHFPKKVNKKEEVDHAESKMLEMKNSDRSDKKLTKLFQCANEGCINIEQQPKEFSTCSRCKATYYCSRECQTADWKRHKNECKNGEAAKKKTDNKDQNKDERCLRHGQAQQLLTIFRYVHHFAVISEEMMSTKNTETTKIKDSVLPQLESVEMGTIQLELSEVTFVWNAIWSMTQSDRIAMMQRFLTKEVPSLVFSPKQKGGPDFSVISAWASKTIAGNFAVVKHTPKGSILLHEDGGFVTNDNDDEVYNAYLVIGISQSIQSLLDPMNKPLPIYINTAILPFKKSIVCQDTTAPTLQSPKKSFKAIAISCTNGHVEMDVSALL